MEPDKFDNFYPYGDRILVEIIPVETETAGGVVLPQAAQERPTRGTVIRTGGGARNDSTGERMPIGVKAGDIVLFSKYGGVDVSLGDDVLLIREADVLAVEPIDVGF